MLWSCVLDRFVDVDVDVDVGRCGGYKTSMTVSLPVWDRVMVCRLVSRRRGEMFDRSLYLDHSHIHMDLTL